MFDFDDSNLKISLILSRKSICLLILLQDFIDFEIY